MPINKLLPLFHGALASGVLFTVPATHTYHLRWVKVVNDTAAPVKFKLGINGTGVGQEITQTIEVPPGESYREYLHCSMPGTPAKTLNALLVSGSGATLFIDGIDES